MPPPAKIPPYLLSPQTSQLATPQIPLSRALNKDLPADTLVLTKSTSDHADADASARKSFIRAHHTTYKPSGTGDIATATTGGAAGIGMQTGGAVSAGRGVGNNMRINAEEVLRAMERRKLLVGVGIERGGCTLVNEERRKTFGEGVGRGAGIRRVVDADY
jgi:hypothetical protein